MEGMAIEFLAHAEQWSVEPELSRRLMGDTLDVERLIESLDQITAARSPLASLGDLSIPLDRIDIIRSEVEWFLQHVAERVSASDASLMWGSVLRASKTHALTFITTNYDRAIELAANTEDVSLADGFDAFTGKEVARWAGFPAADDSQPLIVKLHGSTDWYSDRGSGDPLKLRHPMALFGQGTLRLSGGQELGSSLVLPSREKLLNRAPYPRLSQAFLNVVDECDVAVFVGSSLRDPHVRDGASTIGTERSVFIVNPSGDTLGVQRALPVAQPASQFLISTLPAALASADPVGMLTAHARTQEARRKTSILALLRVATNTHEHTERRCEAIEELDDHSVTLDEHLVRILLSDDDATVCRYALLRGGPWEEARGIRTGPRVAYLGSWTNVDNIRYVQRCLERPSTSSVSAGPALVLGAHNPEVTGFKANHAR